MVVTPERALRRVRGLIGTAGSERASAVTARVVLRAVLFDGRGVPAWRRDAACARVSPEVFHPDPPSHRGIEAAKRVCRSCPVRAECLADALAWESSGRRSGVVAGLSARERDRLARVAREQDGGVAA